MSTAVLKYHSIAEVNVST